MEGVVLYVLLVEVYNYFCTEPRVLCFKYWCADENA